MLYRLSSFHYRIFIAMALLAIGFVTLASAQRGDSDASFARSRQMAESGGVTLVPGSTVPAPIIPRDTEIAVEEFVNYHTHNIAAPIAGEAVALDLRWGNDKIYLSD